MEDKKLIPLSDFVLKSAGGIIPMYDYKQIRKYTLFLKKKLELGYFIPCDKKGIPLNKPKYYDMYLGGEYEKGSMAYQVGKNYQEAKTSCIFQNNLVSLESLKIFIRDGFTIEQFNNYYYEKHGEYLRTTKEF